MWDLIAGQGAPSQDLEIMTQAEGRRLTDWATQAPQETHSFEVHITLVREAVCGLLNDFLTDCRSTSCSTDFLDGGDLHVP